MVPAILVNVVLQLFAFLNYNLGLDLSSFGFPKEKYGMLALITADEFGQTNAFTPLISHQRSFCNVTLNKAEMKPVVEDGEIVIRKYFNLNMVWDHRYADGSALPKMVKAVRGVWADPKAYN